MLAGAGHRVRVVADAPGERQSSGAAGAVWFPYLAEPRAAVDRWARATYTWLEGLHRSTPQAGVLELAPIFAAADDEAPPHWTSALPAAARPVFEPGDRIPDALRRRGSPLGAWRFLAPVVDPHAHLEWLRSSVALEERRVDDLGALPGDVVVNCTGARAGALTADPELHPTLGQVLHAEAGGLPRGCVLVDDRDEGDLFYTIDRGPERGYVVGGCNLAAGGPEEWNAAEPPAARDELTEAIIARARRVGLEPRNAVPKAGWRPVRSTVRVEREGRVVHDYGHGGSGFTLAYGCALDVLALVGG